MSEQHSDLINWLDTRVVDDVEKLYKQGHRSNTIPDTVVKESTQSFKTALQLQLKTFPDSSLATEAVDSLCEQYSGTLIFTMQIKEGLIK